MGAEPLLVPCRGLYLWHPILGAPASGRHLCEHAALPSDHYACFSQREVACISSRLRSLTDGAWPFLQTGNFTGNATASTTANQTSKEVVRAQQPAVNVAAAHARLHCH